MIALFEMIVVGFASLLRFFAKWTTFTNFTTAVTAIRVIGRKTLIAILIAMIIAYFTLLTAFIYFVFEAVTTVYNLVSDLIEKITQAGFSGSSILDLTFYLLNVSGVAAGLQAVFPLIAAALTFRLLIFLKKYFLFYAEQLKGTTASLITIVTAP